MSPGPPPRAGAAERSAELRGLSGVGEREEFARGGEEREVEGRKRVTQLVAWSFPFGRYVVAFCCIGHFADTPSNCPRGEAGLSHTGVEPTVTFVPDV